MELEVERAYRERETGRGRGKERGRERGRERERERERDYWDLHSIFFILDQRLKEQGLVTSN